MHRGLAALDRVLLNPWVSRLGAVQTLFAAGAALVATGVAGAIARVLLGFPTPAMVVTMVGVFVLTLASVAVPLGRRQVREQLQAEARAFAYEYIGWLEARRMRRPGPEGGLTEQLDYRRGESSAELTRRQTEQAAHDAETLAQYQERFSSRALSLFDRALPFGTVGKHVRPFVASPKDVRDLANLAKLFDSFPGKLTKEAVRRRRGRMKAR